MERYRPGISSMLLVIDGMQFRKCGECGLYEGSLGFRSCCKGAWTL